MAAPSLRRDRQFTVFCAGQGISMLGTQFTVVAVPLLARQDLHADGVGLGLLQASVYVAYLVISLPAGVVGDRHRKRPLLIVADIARFLLVLAVPLLWWAGLLTMPLLYALAFAVGCFTVVFEVALMAYLPFLVTRDRLTEANSWMTAAEAAAGSAGPGLAGLVVQATRSPPVAVLGDAFSYLVSVFSLAAIRRPEPRPQPRERHARAEIGEGLRYVLADNRAVRGLAIQGLFFNGGTFAFLVSFLLLATSVQKAGASWYGATLTVAGVGAVVGATQVMRLTRRFGRGRVYGAAVIGSVVPFFLVPLAGGTKVFMGLVWMAGFLLANICVGIVNVMGYTLRQVTTPDAMLGRMSATIRLILYAAIPVGSLLGGVLSDAFSPRAGLAAAAAIMTLSLLPLRSVLPALERPG
jgi:MFS family permease